jgi:hypothetical protein
MATAMPTTPHRQHSPTLPTTRHEESGFVNIDSAQRVLSALGGGALAVFGLERRSLAAVPAHHGIRSTLGASHA